MKAVEEIEDQRNQDSGSQQGKGSVHGSGALQDNRFQHVGGVFGFVGGSFQRLVDLFQLDQLDGVTLVIEQAANGLPCDVIGFALEALDLHTMIDDLVLVVFQQAHSLGELFSLLHHDLRKLGRSR